MNCFAKEVQTTQSGMVLVLVMLFLLVLTLIVTSGLSIVIMETKMSKNFVSYVTLMQAAENKLSQYEQKLVQSGKAPGSEIISTDLCNVTIYRVTASVIQGTASCELQSTFAKVGDTSRCEPKPNIVQGRQSWRIN